MAVGASKGRWHTKVGQGNVDIGISGERKFVNIIIAIHPDRCTGVGTVVGVGQPIRRGISGEGHTGNDIGVGAGAADTFVYFGVAIVIEAIT